MTDSERKLRDEIQRLNGRIAALEAICATLLSQLVRETLTPSASSLTG